MTTFLAAVTETPLRPDDWQVESRNVTPLAHVAILMQSPHTPLTVMPEKVKLLPPSTRMPWAPSLPGWKTPGVGLLPMSLKFASVIPVSACGPSQKIELDSVVPPWPTSVAPLPWSVRLWRPPNLSALSSRY